VSFFGAPRLSSSNLAAFNELSFVCALEWLFEREVFSATPLTINARLVFIYSALAAAVAKLSLNMRGRKRFIEQWIHG
jgi:hypothetical protein